MSKVHTGNIQPQLDYEEHVGDAKAKRVVIVGTDGSQYNEVHVSAAGALSTSGSGGGGGGTVDQGTGGSSPWLVKVDQTGTNNEVQALQATSPWVVSGSVTADTEITTKDYDTGAGTDTVGVVGILLPKSGGSVAGGTSTDPLRVDPTGTTTQPTSDTQVITDNAGFTDGTSKVFVSGHIFDEVAGTALTENDAAASRVDSKRAQVMVIEDSAARGQRASVDINGNQKVTGGSGSNFPTTDLVDLIDNAAFSDGTSALAMAGFILDEVAGTALSENDAAAARVDSKRALIFTIEDETTRGQRATVTAGKALKVDANQATAANLNATVVQTTAANLNCTADTELPAAAALADGATNPTTPLVGECMLQFNGTTWDRVRSSFQQTRTGSASGAGAGTAVDMTSTPMASYSIFNVKDGGTVTSYTVTLEGSLDNTNWTTLITNTNASGLAQMAFTTGKPCLYMRSNVGTIAGAGGTVKTVILACRAIA